MFTLVQTRNIDTGLVGLMLSYALSTTQTLNWIGELACTQFAGLGGRLTVFRLFAGLLVRSATEVETNIVSVERVQEYTELKPEAPLEIKETKPVPQWPEHGALSFRGVSARYRENLDLVLREVSFDIKGGEKVGVCGRTGAGKSSLTMVSSLLCRVFDLWRLLNSGAINRSCTV